MDVLVIEQDEMIGAMLAEALAEDGLSVAVLPDHQALDLAAEPKVVITGMNRRSEDLRGLGLARKLRARWPGIGVIYLAALWPARLRERSLDLRERFLTKPVRLTRMLDTVRDLMSSDFRSVAGQQGFAPDFCPPCHAHPAR